MPLMKQLPRQPGRVTTRTRILDAALELFADQGFERTTVRQIAGRAKLTDAALYYYFPSKEQLLRSLFDERWRFRDVWHARALEPSGPICPEMLERLVDRTLHGIEENALMLRLEARRCLAGDEQAIELRNQRMEHWRAMALAQFDDRFHPDEAALLVEALQAIMVHVGLRLQVESRDEIGQRIADPAFRERIYAMVRRAVPLERFSERYEATA